tara:strand:+ start:30 stop:269 length:240 start_codon:yes stop_codon:yes gene_type:complete
MIKLAPQRMALIPIRPAVITKAIIPPIIETPAVQFNTPNESVADGAGGGLGVHASTGEVALCPHEHPSRNRIGQRNNIL